jgi:hypothetical protein
MKNLKKRLFSIVTVERFFSSFGSCFGKFLWNSKQLFTIYVTFIQKKKKQETSWKNHLKIMRRRKKRHHHWAAYKEEKEKRKNPIKNSELSRVARLLNEFLMLHSGAKATHILLFFCILMLCFWISLFFWESFHFGNIKYNPKISEFIELMKQNIVENVKCQVCSLKFVCVKHKPTQKNWENVFYDFSVFSHKTLQFCCCQVSSKSQT